MIDELLKNSAFKTSQHMTMLEVFAGQALSAYISLLADPTFFAAIRELEKSQPNGDLDEILAQKSVTAAIVLVRQLEIAQKQMYKKEDAPRN